jgi:propionate CoA-transferase
VLTEIAPGIDLQTQVLDLMNFQPVRIAEPLLQMDPSLFME